MKIFKITEKLNKRKSFTSNYMYTIFPTFRQRILYGHESNFFLLNPLVKKIALMVFFFISVYLPALLPPDVHAIAPEDAFYTVDEVPGDLIGTWNSIAIGTDGFPIIAHYDASNANLRVTHCKSIDCNSTAGYDTNVIDSAPSVGMYNSIAIGSDGFPIISYFDNDARNLKVAHCKSIDCNNTAGYDINVIDSGENVGKHTSIAIGWDELPIISYWDAANQSIKIAHCNDLECSDSPGSEIDITTFSHPEGDSTGAFSSVAINHGAVGYSDPFISYHNDTDRSLEVFHCINVSCTAGSVYTVQSSDATGYQNSIMINAHHPMIVHRDMANDYIQIIYCKTKYCDDLGGSGYFINNIDIAETYDKITMALTPDEKAVVSYHDDPRGLLKVALCTDHECNSSTIQSISVNDPHDGGRYPAIAVATNGIPLVAYWDDHSLNVWYGRSWTPLLDMGINLQHTSDESTNEIQVVTDRNLNGDFTTKNSSNTTGSGVTIGSDGIVDDLWLLNMHPTVGASPLLYIKPKYYLSQSNFENIGYGDYRDGNRLTFGEEFKCGDLNNDDQVSGPDFTLFLNDYGNTGVGDFNGDSIVNAIDFSFFISNYGENGAYLTNLIDLGVTDKSWVW
jgi:hypothetical protein